MIEILEPETDAVLEKRDETTTYDPAKVILFNDEIHSFDEVIGQLIKALKCNTTKAESIATETHEKGRAIVFGGDMMECLRVQSILEEIQLMTQIEV